ncbi:hypothetical protein NHX12_029439 [Muraenolepis orangiensis]|uniref:Uncharacterized protein n=1 Tax=Muraenolepis orangiensis TaxID=630683 RepID=A0A9Q0EC89_9TELE|nr:hypothetical protein NHX12_029439 [Muraenolepis orangiensis]
MYDLSSTIPLFWRTSLLVGVLVPLWCPGTPPQWALDTSHRVSGTLPPPRVGPGHYHHPPWVRDPTTTHSGSWTPPPTVGPGPHYHHPQWVRDPTTTTQSGSGTPPPPPKVGLGHHHHPQWVRDTTTTQSGSGSLLPQLVWDTTRRVPGNHRHGCPSLMQHVYFVLK